MLSWVTGLWRSHRGMVLAVCAVAAAVIVGALIWPVTDLIAAHDVGSVAGEERAFHLQAAREAVRTQLLTLGAGLFAAGALVYTARNFTLARHQLDLSRRAMELTEQGQRRTLELTEQGQVTDRYTKAIEQLGSDKLDVRIGGIYALERIARDSPRDHPTVIEVLAAFVREHSREQWPAAEAGSSVMERSTRPDVQAALTVIGRRDPAHDTGLVNLAQANLTRADLRNADLSRATFFQADLTGTVFFRAQLSGAVFYGAHLTGAILVEAKLKKAMMDRANLATADLTNADLTGARLASADLSDAIFIGACLAGAVLLTPKLNPVSLALAADLRGAKVPTGGPLPQGWVLDGGHGLKRAGS